MISEDELRYYKQLDERQGQLFLGMKAKLLGRVLSVKHSVLI